jgi:hypothetical protein
MRKLLVIPAASLAILAFSPQVMAQAAGDPAAATTTSVPADDSSDDFPYGLLGLLGLAGLLGLKKHDRNDRVNTARA